MIKVFTNYKEALNSFEVGNRKHLGITSPGRIRGFDVCTFIGLTITIGHTGGTAIKQTELIVDDVSDRGVLYTKQGCVIQSDEELILSGLGNSASPSVLIELVICRHTYVEIAGGSIPEFRLEPSSFVPLNNEIIIGRIFTRGNAADYNNSHYYPEFNDIGYQLKLSKFIERAQEIKALTSGNILEITSNDKPIIIINNPDQDLYYISNPHKNTSFTLLIGAIGSTYLIKSYTNTSTAPFGFSDIATPKNVGVELIAGGSYEFTWVTLPSFEGWMLMGGNNNFSGLVSVDALDLPQYLVEKIVIDGGSGLSTTILTTGNKKRIQLGLDNDYISNQYIQDTQNYKTALSVLDQDLFQIQKGIMAGLIPESWQTGKLVILSGCLITGTNPGLRTITAGFVYYNGQVYIVNATSFTTGVGEIGIWSIYTAAIYPVMQFTAGVSGSGLFDESDLNVKKYGYLNNAFNFSGYNNDLAILSDAGGVYVIPLTNKTKDFYSAFNLSNSRFTVVVSGYYNIAFSSSIKNNTSASSVNFIINKNNTGDNIYQDADSTPSPMPTTFSKVLFLNEGDFVTVKVSTPLSVLFYAVRIDIYKV